MLKLGFLTITGCSFWNIFFPPRGGLGPKGCVGRTLMFESKPILNSSNLTKNFLRLPLKNAFDIANGVQWRRNVFKKPTRDELRGPNAFVQAQKWYRDNF